MRVHSAIRVVRATGQAPGGRRRSAFANFLVATWQSRELWALARDDAGAVEGFEAPGTGPHIRVLTEDFSKRTLRRNNREMIVGMHFVNSPSSQTMTPEGLRVRARQVRALARSVADHEAAPTIRAFADELEAKADALEIYSATRNDGTARAGIAGPLPNA